MKEDVLDFLYDLAYAAGMTAAVTLVAAIIVGAGVMAVLALWYGVIDDKPTAKPLVPCEVAS